VLAAGAAAPGITPAAATPGAAGVARVLAGGAADPVCRMPLLLRRRSHLLRTRPRLRRRSHLQSPRRLLNHRLPESTSYFLEHGPRLSYVTTQVHCSMRNTFLMCDASGQDHRDLVSLLYIHVRHEIEVGIPSTMHRE